MVIHYKYICDLWAIHMLNPFCGSDSRQKLLEDAENSTVGGKCQIDQTEKWSTEKFEWNEKPLWQPDPEYKPVKER